MIDILFLTEYSLANSKLVIMERGSAQPRLRVARRGLAPAPRAALARVALTRVARARLEASFARERALRRRDVGHGRRVGTH